MSTVNLSWEPISNLRPAHVSRASINNIESMTKTHIDMSNCKSLCANLLMTLDYIFMGLGFSMPPLKEAWLSSFFAKLCLNVITMFQLVRVGII